MSNSVIPIKNIFYMLCYAWNVLPMKGILKGSEDEFGDAYNLLAKVFDLCVGKVIKLGLHHSYVEIMEDLSAVRGKINVQESVNRMTLQSKKIVCDFDEYSINNNFNRIVKYTILNLVRNNQIDKVTRANLKKKLAFFSEIDDLEPTKDNCRRLIFNRNNALYRLLISVSIMIHTNTVVNEQEGKHIFADFYREEQMERVFELFLLNFYSAHLDKNEYKVYAPKVFWPIDKNAAEIWETWFDIDIKGTNRRTDIAIENKLLNRQYIVDAKYYKNAFVKKHFSTEEETFRVSHLNQIRGYILDSNYCGEKVGALLYPLTNRDAGKGIMIPIKDANIIIKTVNLNAEWRMIEADLLDFLKRMERKL